MSASSLPMRWPLSPEPLLKDALDLWSSRALAAGQHLGLFAELGKGPRTAARLAALLGLAPDATRDLLDALLALGWLQREGDDADAVYVSTRTSAHFLDPRSPGFMGELLMAARQPLTGPDDSLLDDALRLAGPSGRPAMTPPPAWAAAQALVRERMASLHGEALAGWPGLGELAQVIDLDGAGAHLTCAWAARCRGRQPGFAVVRPAAQLPLAQAQVQAAGQASRVRVLAGPVDGLPPRALAGGGDAVVLSLLLQPLAAAERRTRLAQARAWLAPQGRLLMLDLLADTARREQVPALVFGLAARMIGHPHGVLTEGELRADCQAAGLRDGECLPLPGGACALVAELAP
ncbi:methyltransferase dimerization domain-containing protein [Roseateles sp.]|uniref:methyltransferase family protein n=1 Tax=Roseateles sp. TaxID=1971397 RepID=UPI003937D6AE